MTNEERAEELFEWMAEESTKLFKNNASYEEVMEFRAKLKKKLIDIQVDSLAAHIQLQREALLSDVKEELNKIKAIEVNNLEGHDCRTQTVMWRQLGNGDLQCDICGRVDKVGKREIYNGE